VNWRKVQFPDAVPETRLRDFAAWRDARWASRPERLGHTEGGRMLPVNARLYRKRVFEAAGGDNIGPLLDNVSLTAVPLPAAAWLLLSGLVGFAALGRRKLAA